MKLILFIRAEAVRVARAARSLAVRRFRKAADQDLDAEIRSHIELRTQANLEAGMNPAEARTAALRQFGGVESIREACREEREGLASSLLTSVGADLRFALRQLRRNPGFTAMALVTLALGIGANTAVFSVVDQLLNRPLPVAEPERLAIIAAMRDRGGLSFSLNYPLFQDYQRESKVFSYLCAVADRAVGLSTGDATERNRALLVSGNYFSMLGVNAALGRTFAANEGVEPGDAPVAVLGHGFWVRRFGADPAIAGRTVSVNGKPFTVIGVAPREFTGTARGFTPDLYLPITMMGALDDAAGAEMLASRYHTWHEAMGRLKDGVSHAQAQTALRTLTAQLQGAHSENTETNVLVLPGAQGQAGNIREASLPLNLLLITSGLVLLVACANLANFQLARGADRAREMAIRLALGAGRLRIVRSLLAESLLLAATGGALGMLVAAGVTAGFERFLPAEAVGMSFTPFDPRVMGFAAAAALLTGVAFGLAPAWRASRPDLVPELKGGAGHEAAATNRWRPRDALVVLQIAVSMVALVCAVLCARSLGRLQSVDSKLEPSRVVLLSLDLALNNYTEARALEFYDRLLERARELPGVEAAGIGQQTPLSGSSISMSIERIEGYETRAGEVPIAGVNRVSPGYFRALGAAILRGRDFRASDQAASPKVVVVDEVFARRYWPGADPLGKRLFQRDIHGVEISYEVVGLAQNVKVRRLGETPFPAMYFPQTQGGRLARTLVVRTGIDPGGTITQLREAARALDANVPVFRVWTLAQQRDNSLILQRALATFLGGFGVIAALLAMAGLHGLLAYAVSRRRREIGIRMALGARAAEVVRLVLGQGMRLTLIGLACGVTGGLAATRALRGLLYEVSPMDPLTFLVVAALLAVTAVFACWMPAQRATHANPMAALRSE